MNDRQQLPELFADGVSLVSFSEVFRIVFAGIDPQTNQQSRDGVRLHPKMTVMMPVNGFLQAFRAMKDVIDQMVDAGVLDKNAVEAAMQKRSGGNGAAAAPTAVAKQPRSSNFD